MRIGRVTAGGNTDWSLNGYMVQNRDVWRPAGSRWRAGNHPLSYPEVRLPPGLPRLLPAPESSARDPDRYALAGNRTGRGKAAPQSGPLLTAAPVGATRGADRCGHY